MPSHVTADLAAETVALTHDELRERMSGNLCRCGAHNGIVDAIADSVYAEARGMTPFSYARAGDAGRGGPPAAQLPSAKYLGGGTNLVDLMRETIEQPAALVDVTGLLGAASRSSDDGGLVIGAAAQEHRGRRASPRCASAIRAGPRDRRRRLGADPQHGDGRRQLCCSAPAAPTSTTTPARAATSASPAQGCDAIEGFNRNHAILGASPACVATHPSDMCVALAALDAVVASQGAHGDAQRCRSTDLHRLPGDTPDIETVLEPGELITAIELPPLPLRRRARPIARCATGRATPSRWSRSPPRSSCEDGSVNDVRLALGGVAPQAVAGPEGRGGAARRSRRRGSISAPRPRPSSPMRAAAHDNAFKIELAKRTIVGTCSRAQPGSAYDERRLQKPPGGRPMRCAGAGCPARLPDPLTDRSTG